MSVSPTVQVIGVHPLPDVASWFLVEVVIDGCESVPNFGQFTQSLPGRQQPDWLVAYDEKLLDDEVFRVLGNVFLRRPSDWPKRARVAFFFHFLDLERPLETPFGDASLPLPSDRPPRLDVLGYEAP